MAKAKSRRAELIDELRQVKQEAERTLKPLGEARNEAERLALAKRQELLRAGEAFADARRNVVAAEHIWETRIARIENELRHIAPNDFADIVDQIERELETLASAEIHSLRDPATQERAAQLIAARNRASVLPTLPDDVADALLNELTAVVAAAN